METMTTTAPARATSSRRSGWPALAAAFAVLVAAVVGIFVRPAGASVYAYALTPGQTRTYAMSMRMAFTPSGIPGVAGTVRETMTGRMTMKVTDVADDGSTTLKMTMTDVRASGELAEPGEFQNGTITMRISESGELLSVEGPNFFGMDPSDFFGGTRQERTKDTSVGSSNMLPSYPSEALEPGDTWTQTEEVPLGVGDNTLRMTMDGEHAGFEESAYGRVARMKMRFQSPLDVSMSFAEALGLTGDAAGAEELPAELRAAQMVMRGSITGDLASLVIPDTCDMVTMGMNTKMNVAIGLENVPADVAAAMPANMRMVGTMAMKLNRIA